MMLANRTRIALEQHFLDNVAKRRQLRAAADVAPSDHVVELGAGRGSVAALFSHAHTLTLVEYDPHLADRLRERFPAATVIQGDAREILPILRFDVLLSNLPHTLTDDIVTLLKDQTFRRALVATHDQDDLSAVADVFDVTPVMVLDPADFAPPQPFRSRVYELAPRQSAAERSPR